MKFALTLLTFAFASAASAADAPRFSAFSQGDDLYVTILADSCNHLSGTLDVDALCRADRLTKNWAQTCDASLQVMMTQMACNDEAPVARVVQLSLNGQNVATESDTLNLTYNGQTIEVKLQR